ncbi:MAG: WYL domain-containing protein [Butyrivibrio sp.]|nr:WYL domain-containing protein [Butyrivibrio sp.]
MARGANQKLKLYYLNQIMTKYTDDEHYLTMPEILSHLEEYGIEADRKSIYDDIEALRGLGVDIIMEQEGRSYYYHLGARQFEMAELKLLVDAVQSSKFITAKKSDELIDKITGLVSEYQAKELRRQVEVQGRVKTMNESIYYIVDELHTAILGNKQITFEYLTWNLKKELVPRREGLYEESPWALTWDDENYYLIAYDTEEAKIKHFRVDKIRDLTIVDKKREGRDVFEAIDMASYINMNFGMFGKAAGVPVNLRFKNDMVGIVIDRFGKDIPIKPSGEEGWSDTRVTVMISGQFFGWVFAMGGLVKIIGPDNVLEMFNTECRKQLGIED